MSEVRYQTSVPVPEYSGDRTRKEGELAMCLTTFRPVALPLMREIEFAMAGPKRPLAFGLWSLVFGLWSLAWRPALISQLTGKGPANRDQRPKAKGQKPKASFQYRLKLYSNCMYTETGRPPLVAGTNRICRAATMAFSVNPNGSD